MASLKFFCFFLSTILVICSSDLDDVYRLPNDVIPLTYHVKIVPKLENWTFVGEVDINVHVKFTTDRIILHSRYLDIRNITLREHAIYPNGTAGHKTTWAVDQDNQILIIKNGGQFHYDTDYNISIMFQGEIAYMQMRGYFAMGLYKGYEPEASTHNEATGARSIFPCFDEPRFRTSFTISIARPENYTVVSNMPSEMILPPDSLSGGLVWEKFKPTPPMPSYLVAFTISQLESLTNEDKRLRVLTKPESVKNASYALKQAGKLLEYFEGYLGIRYALPKLDLVTFPHHPAYAMENWGLVTFRDDILLLDDINSAEKKQSITSVVSHELAHLWFGDLVTIPWYDYLWLKEGFASYFEHFGTAAIEPSWDIESIFVIKTLHESLSSDIGGRSRPMTSSLRYFLSIPTIYDHITNDKAACVIRMFEYMVSTSTFKNALHNYLKNGLKDPSNGVTTPRNLFDAFDQQVELDSVSNLPPHVSASDIMKTWTENWGYPVINVARNENGEVIVTQSPFKPKRLAKETAKWIVPLTYTTQSEPQFSNVLPSESDWSFADKPTVIRVQPMMSSLEDPQWILFNLKQTGYYRVNYDETGWQLLINQLVVNHTVIHPLNRAQLIDDAVNFAYNGKVKYSTVFSLLEYLKDETDVVPWHTAVSAYHLMNDDFAQSKITSDILKGFFRELFPKMFNQIKCNGASAKNDHITQISKPRLLAFGKRLNLTCASP